MPGTTSPIRVLHLEDSLRDAEIIRDTLESDGPACDVVHVDSRARFASALAGGPFDVIICDFNLPDLDGLTALRLVKETLPETPVIIVSGAIDPAEAVECLKQGATDYLLKQRLDRLPSAVKRAVAEAEQRRQRLQMDAKLRESEERFRLLLVEDSGGLRKLARRILVSAGYRVLPAANGEEALLVLERHEESVHLLLTDVIMPGMNGRVLAERVGEVRPGMKVLYTSGYTDDAIVHHGVLDEGTAFVGKPFTAAELLRKVREVLDSP